MKSPAFAQLAQRTVLAVNLYVNCYALKSLRSTSDRHCFHFTARQTSAADRPRSLGTLPVLMMCQLLRAATTTMADLRPRPVPLSTCYTRT